MEELDVWSLIQSGRFDEACKKADSEYDKSKSVFVLRNKVYALLHLKMYEECNLLTEEIIRLVKGEASTDFITCGIVNWLLERKDVAIKLWKQGIDSLFQDAAGGIDVQVFLFYASLKLNDVNLKVEVIKKLRNLLSLGRVGCGLEH